MDERPPPWKEASKGKSASRQERRNGRLPDSRVQLNSGRHWFAPRDNRIQEFLVETRQTKAKTYSIEKQEWRDIVKRALSYMGGYLPGMQVDLDGEQLFIMRLEDKVALTSQLGEYHARLVELGEISA